MAENIPKWRCAGCGFTTTVPSEYDRHHAFCAAWVAQVVGGQEVRPGSPELHRVAAQPEPAAPQNCFRPARCAGCGCSLPIEGEVAAHADACPYSGVRICCHCGFPVGSLRSMCRSENHPQPGPDRDAAVGPESSAALPTSRFLDAEGDMRAAGMCELLEELAAISPGARRRIIRTLQAFFEVS